MRTIQPISRSLLADNVAQRVSKLCIEFPGGGVLVEGLFLRSKLLCGGANA